MASACTQGLDTGFVDLGYIKVAALGVVQGITELLPISSTAHMRIVPALFGWKDPGSAFSAAMQLAALAAVITYFWSDVRSLLFGVIGAVKRRDFGDWTFRFALWIVLATGSFYVHPLEPLVFPFFAVLTTIIFGRILTGAVPRIHVPRFCRDHLRITGVCSYSIYLLHQPLMAAMPEVLHYWFSGTLNPLLVYLACGLSWLVIMPLGWLWYRLGEKPSIACGKRIIRYWLN